jgi:Glycosyl hydrolase family 26
MPWTPRHVRTPARVLALLLVPLLALPSAASAGTVQFGAWTPGDPYYGATQGADALEAATGRRVDIVNWYQNWGGDDWISSVQQHLIGAVTGGGRIPLLTWEPWKPGAGAEQPTYRLARIAGGDFDGYIASWADGLKAVGATVYLRPMHEMNGDWYPWSGAVNGNSPALYVQAWRRMVEVFRQRGAANVRFVWSPNNFDVPSSNKLEGYYPGSSYVDVLAVDGYNWGSERPEYGGWQSFSAVFGTAYERLRALGPQPIWIAEVGSAPEGGDKAAWIGEMFARAQDMNRLEAVVWFNENKERDWRAAPTPEIAAAFAPATSAGAGTTGSTGITASTGASDGAGSTGTSSRLRPEKKSGRPMLRLMGKRRTSSGRRATVRWRATGAASVTRWDAYVNGRRARRAGRRVARARVARPGRYRWTVIGRDARGRRVVSARRAFRVIG